MRKKVIITEEQQQQLQQGIRVFVSLVLPDFEFLTCCLTLKLLLVLSLQMYFRSSLLSTEKVLRSQATSFSSFAFYVKNDCLHYVILMFAGELPSR